MPWRWWFLSTRCRNAWWFWFAVHKSSNAESNILFVTHCVPIFPPKKPKNTSCHFCGGNCNSSSVLCKFTIFSYCFSQVSSVTWKITTECNWTNIIKYSNKEIQWLYSEVLVSTETLKNIWEKLKFWCFRLSKAGLLHRLSPGSYGMASWSLPLKPEGYGICISAIKMGDEHILLFKAVFKTPFLPETSWLAIQGRIWLL